MPSTMNITRATSRGNESGLSGEEAVSVENVGIPDQVISAATEEQTALGAFKDHQLKTLALLCDQAVSAQFLGVRTPVTDLPSGANTVTHAGTLVNMIRDGDLIRIEGSVADDGIYQVENVAAGIITLADGNLWPTGDGGAVGTVARVCTQQRMGYPYDIATAVPATGIITILGDVSDVFAAGDFCIVDDSTGNDGVWAITVVTTDGPPVTTTSITLLEATDAAAATILDNTADGNVIKVRPAIELAANIPFQWSYESGIQNPFIQIWPDAVVPMWILSQYNDDVGDVAFCMVNNPGAVNANFAGRIGTNAIIF